MATNSGKKWSKDETILAYALYCSTPYGKIHANNPEIITLANILGRSASSVAMKMGNLAHFDPDLKKRNVSGLTNGSKLDKEVYQEFESNLEELNFQAYQIKQGLVGNQPLDIPFDYSDLPEGKDKIIKAKTRIGQDAFRATVLNSYGNKCCITGINNPKLLVASHIKPWKDSDSATEKTNPRNGLCLNSLHDKAFDCGLITIDKTFHVIISQNLVKTDMDEQTRNWLMTYDHKRINFPDKFAPSPEFIEYHNDVIFQR